VCARARERVIVLARLVILLRLSECISVLLARRIFLQLRMGDSWVMCLYEILFQIRENVSGDFWYVKTSVWGRSRELNTNPPVVQTFKRGPNFSWGQWTFRTYNIKKWRKYPKSWEVIRSNRRLTVREVAENFWISKSKCHEILTKHLGMHRVAAM
jgi:hypothetical protein